MKNAAIHSILMICIGLLSLSGAAVAGDNEPVGSGTVSGLTLSVVKGHPGALIGKPDPNYKAPDPRIAPNEKVYWLRIDPEEGHKLFSTESDHDGKYTIQLTPGKYVVEPASMHELDLRRLDHPEMPDCLIRVVFPSWKIQGKPDLVVESGQTYRMDIEARILYVD